MKKLLKRAGIIFVFAFMALVVYRGIFYALPQKFTDKQRPPQLEKVREVVMQTPLGQQAAAYLEPINVSSVAGTLAEKAGSAVTEKVTQEVTSRAVSQIISQIDTLPQDQRTLLEEAICKKNE